jgi:two-component system CheB/CheR fusion protein
MALAWGAERVLLYNDAFAVIAGARHPAAFGRSLRGTSATLPVVDAEAVTAVLERGESRSLHGVRCRVERSGRAEELELSTSYAPVRREDGRVAGAMMVLQATSAPERRPETEREHALFESREQLRVLFEEAPIAMCISRQVRTVETNRAYRELFGFASAEEARGTPIRDRWAPESLPMVEEFAHRRARGIPVPSEYEGICLRTDGSRFPAHVAATMVHLPNGMATVGFITDITDRHQAAEGLRHANTRLQEMDQRKNQFLAALSHELRNPLAPIHYSLEILRKCAPGGEQAHRAHAVIERQVAQLTRLVNDLLDATRISRGNVELERERLDLDALVRQTADDHRPVFDAAGLEVEVRGAQRELWVNGDLARLGQAIGNLLHNAAKFTPRGGHVTVSVRCDSAAHQALVSVEDTGPGIAPDLMRRLFQAFTQADTSLDRSKSGLGLGLSLVKGLVELHGGFVRAESDGPGKGSRFTIAVPLEVATPLTVIAGDAEGEQQGARRVLVIEDNVESADCLRLALELTGHVVEVAHAGPDGISKAHAFAPDAVVCDIGLPVMDGYAVARALRQDAALDRVVLVALSGYAFPEDVAKAKQSGFDAHLAKPADIDALRRVLSRRSSERRW